MTFSQSVRLVAAVCAALWIAAPSSSARIEPDRGRPLQIDSPIPTPPVSPIPTPPVSPITLPLGSPISTPPPSPTECVAGSPCNGDDAPTPESGLQTFLPGISQPGGAESQPTGPPPDLGTLLNYVAGAVVVIGVTLKIYWWISDRRKARER